LHACTTCGYRSFEKKQEYSLEELSFRGCLQYDSYTGTLNNEVQSVFQFHDIYYHLHPELVRVENDEAFIRVCKSCEKGFQEALKLKENQKSKFPKFALVNCDYGISSRNKNLPTLSMLEKVVISRYRLLMTTIVISNTTKNSKVASSLKGHGIVFVQDSVDKIVKVLPDINFIHDSLKVVFVGKFDFTKFDNWDNLRINVQSIFIWLQFLQQNHRYYFDIEIDSSEDIKAKLQSLPQHFVTTATIQEEEAKVQIQVNDDVAKVRNEDLLSDIDENQEDDVINNIPLDGVFLTKPTYLITPSEDNKAKFGQVLDLFPADESQHHNIPTKTTSYRIKSALSDEPVNEFLDNDSIFYCCFPYLFVLGNGIYGSGSLDMKQVDHLINQFSNIFSQDFQFISLLQDQKSRHALARNIKAKAFTHPKKFEEFGKFMKSEESKELLNFAVKNPESKEAKKLIHELENILVMTGGKVPFSVGENSVVKTNIFASRQRYGLPSYFFTFANDDVHNPLSYRLSVKSVSNESFPASGNIEEFLTSLQKNESIFDVKHKIDNSSLHEMISNNPVASAKVFHLLLNSLVEHLFQISFSTTTKKTVPIKKGIFGKIHSVFCRPEVQGRLALHAHLILWGGISPEMINYSTKSKEFMDTIKEIMDDTFKCFIDSNLLLKQIIERHYIYMKKNKKIEEEDLEEFNKMLVQSCRQVFSMPSEDCFSEEFLKRTNEIVLSTNIHLHTHTCGKGETGKIQCRMCYPEVLYEETSIRQYKYEIVDGKIDFEELKEVENFDVDKRYKQFPFAPRDKRTIVLHKKRPFIDHAPVVKQLPQLYQEYLKKYGKEFVAPNSSLEICVQKRNGLVVCYNDILTSTLACNTAAYTLGSVEQSKAALFYLIDYVSKSLTSLKRSLALYQEEREGIEKFGSKAEDNTENTRTALLYASRVQNALTGATELAGTLIACNLLGHASWQCSSNFKYLFIEAATCNIKEKCGEKDAFDLFVYFYF